MVMCLKRDIFHTYEVTKCNDFLSCLSEFQTLITGVLALLAATVTAIVIWRAAKLPVVKEYEHQVLMEKRKKRYNFRLLFEDLRLISNRAKHVAGTIEVTVAANAVITDEIRSKVLLKLPKIIECWEDMSLLEEPLFSEILSLRRQIIDHNFDMERAGGSFGADNFQQSILRRLSRLENKSFELSNIANESFKSIKHDD